MKELIEQALAKKRWAVLGASGNSERFGYKILKHLDRMGYEVYPVNPNYEQIATHKCYAKLSDIEQPVEVVNVVVNKKLAKQFLEEEDVSKLDAIWFQPGSFDDEIIELAKQKNPNVIHGACVLVEAPPNY